MKTIQHNWVTIIFLIIVGCGSIGQASSAKAKLFTLNGFSRVIEKRQSQAKKTQKQVSIQQIHALQVA